MRCTTDVIYASVVKPFAQFTEATFAMFVSMHSEPIEFEFTYTTAECKDIKESVYAEEDTLKIKDTHSLSLNGIVERYGKPDPADYILPDTSKIYAFAISTFFL